MFGKFFKSTPSPTQVSLIKVAIPATDLLSRIKASPEARALYHPGQSSGELLQLLEVNHMGLESVNLLAYGLPAQDAITWAIKSARMVAEKLNPADQKALAAAETWLANPTSETQAAADKAAAATNGSGPGGWAAQAVAWAKSSDYEARAGDVPSGADTTGEEDTPDMTAAAVAGTILLAAGLTDRPPMPDTPRPNAELAKEIPKAEPPKSPAAPENEVPSAGVQATTAAGNTRTVISPTSAPTSTPSPTATPAIPSTPATPGTPAMPGTPVMKAAVPSADLPKGQMPKPEIKSPIQAPDAPTTPPPEVPKPSPAEAKAFCAKLKPFLDLGKQIGSGGG